MVELATIEPGVRADRLRRAAQLSRSLVAASSHRWAYKKGTAGAVRYEERRRSSSFLYMQHPTRERGAGALSYLYLNNRRYAFISM